MKEHSRKMIAPIVVTAILVVYYAIYFALLFGLLDGVWKYILGLIPLALGVMIVRVCIERIHEIQGGEEDDLSQY